MKFFSMAEARAKFAQLITSSEHTHERIVITRNGEPAAVLLSIDDYESMVDQIEILSDPELMAELKQAAADYEEHPDKFVTVDSPEMQAILGGRSN